MNRADKAIAERIRKGGELPIAFNAWHREDCPKVCPSLLTKAYDYTKTGGMVIFEHGKR